MDATQAKLIGTVLERRYRVDALLARGGMSAVYRGVDTRLDRAIAIKIMDPRYADNQSFVHRFQREARSAASLHHPNVVAVHDQGAEQGIEHNRVFLVMELVDGGTLRDLFDDHEGALPVPLALTVIDQVLSALDAAHRGGLAHRDVKPENVLIGRSGARGSGAGVVKVGDFGLVRAVAGAATTGSSAILGTVAYVCPEQVASGTSGARGDVYSAGVLLYEMLTGRPPYTGDTALSVAYQHVNNDVPAPSTQAPWLPAGLDPIVQRATRRDPAQRYTDAAEFRNDLERFRGEHGIAPVDVPVPVPGAGEHTGPVPSAVIDAAESAGQEPVPDQPAHRGAETATSAGATVPVGYAAMSGRLDPGAHAAGAADGASPGAGAPGPGPHDAGPRGTMAMPMDQLAGSGARTPLPAHDAEPTPPQGVPQQRPARRALLWSLLAVVLLGLIGTGTWWFVDGRWVSVPTVDGYQQDKAEQTIRDAQLTPTVTRQRHDTAEAGTVIRTEPAGGHSLLRDSQVTVVLSMGPPVVPDIEPGTAVDKARAALRDTQLKPVTDKKANTYHKEAPEGSVVRTTPAAGTQLKVGQPVTLVLSKGPPPEPVPDVTGKSKKEAFEAIRSVGMKPYEAGKEFSADVPGGHVIRTDPPSGTVREGDGPKRVGVYLSTAVTVPDVTDRSVKDARKALKKEGFKVEVQQFLPRPQSRVLQQSPSAGDTVKPGSTVVIRAFP